MGNIIDNLVEQDFQIGGPDSELLIINSIDKQNDSKNYEKLVDDYFKANKEFKEGGKHVVKSVKDKMVDILLGYGLEIDEFDKAEHNEFFSLAYTEALKVAAGGEDPIDAMRTNGNVSDWDFTFEDFDSFSSGIIIKENIRAAGALYNLFLLGDQMKMYAITDGVILKWWNGLIDVPKGVISNKMYRYYKLRSERNSAEDRAMQYKRIFNLGDGKEMEGTLINSDFSSLWNGLLNEVIKYISKREDKITNEEVISKQPIFRAIREVQYNLSASMTGIANITTNEMYSHFQECKFILSNPEVINQVTRGRNRNINEAIRSLSQELFDETPNVRAYFETATTIKYIFEYISNFNGVAMSTNDLEEFVSLIDNYILNMELINNNNGSGSNRISDNNKENKEEVSEIDEFDDF